ncbi:MAG: hypothetical protein DMG33_09625, partial [Acidobacteria bacterium]
MTFSNLQVLAQMWKHKCLTRRAPFVLLLLFSPLLAAAQSGVDAKVSTQAAGLYSEGMQALQRGDLISARSSFEKVVRLAPRSPEGHNSLGWVLLAEGEIDSAISQFRTALRLNPGFVQAHINLSNAFSRKGDAEAAVREAREAVRLAPQDSEAHRTLGRALGFR